MAHALATVAAALTGALLVWAVWRARAAAARREEVRRALEQLAEDATSLLAAAVTSLDSREPVDTETEDIEIARDATLAAARLLDAARAYASQPERVIPRADGCVRVAIGIVRSRGWRVRLRGVHTELESRASVGETLEALVGMMEHVQATASPGAKPSFIDVELGPEQILVALGPARRVGERASTLTDLCARAERCGWVLEDDGAGAFTLRSGGPPLPPGEVPEDDGVPAPAPMR